MNLRRVFTLSLTLLVAAAAGYGLLGLKAPKQPPPTPPSGAGQTIVAVGPDGNLYAVQVPAAGTGNRAYRQDGDGRYGSEQEGGYSDAYEHE